MDSKYATSPLVPRVPDGLKPAAGITGPVIAFTGPVIGSMRLDAFRSAWPAHAPGNS